MAHLIELDGIRPTIAMNRAAIVGAGPSGFYASRPAAQGRLRGRPLRRAADAVRPRARRRGARPPEDQVGHAGLREDRARSRASASSAASSSASDVTREELLERYHAVVYAVGTRDRQPARHPRRGPPGLARRHRVRRLVQRPPRLRRPRVRPRRRARGRDRQRQRRDRRRAHARARPRRARADRHRRPRDRGARRGAGRARSSCSAAAGPAQAAFTNPELRELGELERADVDRRPGRARARRGSAAGSSPRTADTTARRNVEILREYAAREPDGQDAPRSSCASCARRSRSSATARTAGRAACASARNRIEPTSDGRLRAVPTGERGDDRVRPRAALDRLPRHAARRACRSTSAAA